MLLIGTKKDLASRWKRKIIELEKARMNATGSRLEAIKAKIETLEICIIELEALKDNKNEITNEKRTKKHSQALQH